MRVARVVVPIAIAGTLLAGCGGQAKSGTPAPSAAAASTAPAGNGVADLTADEILTKATAALKKARSFQLKGDMVENGDKMSVDVKVQDKNLLGSMTMKGSTIHLLAVDGQPYFKADAAFWKQNAGAAGPTIAKRLGNKWAKIKAGDQNFADFFNIGNPDELLKPTGTTVTKADTKTIAGSSAIALVDSDQSKLYVATTGEPYPLLMEGPNNSGQAVFSGFGSSFDGLKAPAASEVVDLTKLMPSA
jgi:hypothetical protein